MNISKLNTTLLVVLAGLCVSTQSSARISTPADNARFSSRAYRPQQRAARRPKRVKRASFNSDNDHSPRGLRQQIYRDPSLHLVLFLHKQRPQFKRLLLRVKPNYTSPVRRLDEGAVMPPFVDSFNVEDDEVSVFDFGENDDEVSVFDLGEEDDEVSVFDFGENNDDEVSVFDFS